MTMHRRDLMIGVAGALGAGLSPVAAQPSFALATPVARRGRVAIRGRTIAYDVRLGETVLRNKAGDPRATIFSTSYLARGAAASRPVTFLFNGGPLSSSRAIHENMAPRITVASASAPGFAVADNPDTLLDMSDLVFIDPPGTGFSRFVADDAKPEYWGIEQDAAGIADFMGQWLAANRRGPSPKFIMGTSYSGARLGQLARMLARNPGGPIDLRGVVAISPGLGTGSQNPMAGQADRPSRSLPSQAATAWFHRKGAHLSSSLEDLVAEVRRFSSGPYAAAMASPGALASPQRADMAAQVAGFIGLPPELVAQNDLFVPIPVFMNSLLAERGEKLDLGDGRIHMPTTAREVAAEFDKQAAADAFYRVELGYAAPAAYSLASSEANRVWNNTTTEKPDHVPAIFKQMTDADPRLHVFLTAGYYDLNVPFDLSLDRYLAARLPPAQFDYRLYPTGHGVYYDAAVRPRGTDDLRAFYRRALA